VATSELDAVPNANRLVLEVHAAVCRVDHFLFAHPGHKQELEQQQFVPVARGEEFVQRFLFVNFRLPAGKSSVLLAGTFMYLRVPDSLT
jgi:hypothetical protein